MLYESWGWTAPWNGVPTRDDDRPLAGHRTAHGQDRRRTAHRHRGLPDRGVEINRLPASGANAIADAEGSCMRSTAPRTGFARRRQRCLPGRAGTRRKATRTSRFQASAASASGSKHAVADEWRKIKPPPRRSLSLHMAQDAKHPEWMSWRFKDAPAHLQRQRWAPGTAPPASASMVARSGWEPACR